LSLFHHPLNYSHSIVPVDFFEVLYELAGTDNEQLNKIMSVYFDENGQPQKAS
jgi:hypothetical protein